MKLSSHDKVDIIQKSKIFPKENILIYFQKASILDYINKINQVQEKFDFFPSEHKELSNVYDRIDPNFEIDNLKYDLNSFDKSKDLILESIKNMGISGYNYLKNVNSVIDLNKPILLFYGMEQLASYFSNLHFNFSVLNPYLDNIRRDLQQHGIDHNEFRAILPGKELSIELLDKKIELKISGTASRFFSIFKPELYHLFINNCNLSMRDLLINFFGGNNKENPKWDYFSFPNKVKESFYYLFGNETENELNSPLFSLYLLSYIFSILSRYKMNIWNKLLNLETKNLGYFSKFIIKSGRDYFVNSLFKKLLKLEDEINKILKPPPTSIYPFYDTKKALMDGFFDFF